MIRLIVILRTGTVQILQLTRGYRLLTADKLIYYFLNFKVNLTTKIKIDILALFINYEIEDLIIFTPTNCGFKFFWMERNGVSYVIYRQSL